MVKKKVARRPISKRSATKLTPQTVEKESVTVTNTISFALDGAEAFSTITQVGEVTFTQSLDEKTGRVIKSRYTASGDANVDEFGRVSFSKLTATNVRGYSPDMPIVAATTSLDVPDVVTNVTYFENDRRVTVVVIDDTTGEELERLYVSGATGQRVNWNVVQLGLDRLLRAGYYISSDDTVPVQIFDEHLADDATLRIALQHRTTRDQETFQAVHDVVFVGGGRNTPSNVTQTLQITRRFDSDVVTGLEVKADQQESFPNFAEPDFIGDGDGSVSPSGAITFEKVTVPSITGFYAGQDTITATTDYRHLKIDTTVTYQALRQSIAVDVVDDDTGKVLHKTLLSGATEQLIDYSGLRATLQEFESKGYRLETPDYDQLKTFEPGELGRVQVHLRHGLNIAQHVRSLQATLEFQGVARKTLPMVTAVGVVVDRQTIDEVTRVTIRHDYQGDGDLSVTDEGQITFDEISVPAIPGYQADMTSVTMTMPFSQEMMPNSVVTYTPLLENLVVELFDADAASLLSELTIQGRTDEPIDWEPVDDKLQALFAQGYKLIDPAALKMAYFSATDMPLRINLAHEVASQEEIVTFKHAVSFVGSQKKPLNVEQRLVVTYTYVEDLVTSERRNEEYASVGDGLVDTDGAIQFNALAMPVIAGYETSVDTVAGKTRFSGKRDLVTEVDYQPQPAAASVTFLDDDKHHELKTIEITGETDSEIDWTPLNTELQDYTNAHYVIEESGFSTPKKFEAGKAVRLEIHLSHQRSDYIEQTVMMNVVRYQGADEVTPDAVEQSAKVEWRYTLDEVTGSKENQRYQVEGDAKYDGDGMIVFDAVETPFLEGYAPNEMTVRTRMVYGAPVKEVIVTYKPVPQRIYVVIQDVTTEEALVDFELDGVTNGQIDWTNVERQVSELTEHGYQLENDDWQKLQKFGTDVDDVPEIQLSMGHVIKALSEELTLQHEVVALGLPDNQTFKSKQVAHVKKTYTKDLVTGAEWDIDLTTSGDAATTSSDSLTFRDVILPEVAGYSVDVKSVAKTVPLVADAYLTTVTYVADEQKLLVNFVDEDGLELTPFVLTGPTDSPIDWRIVDEQVQGHLDAGYELTVKDWQPNFGVFGPDMPTVTISMRHQVRAVDQVAVVRHRVDYVGPLPGRMLPAQQTATVKSHYQLDQVTGVKSFETYDVIGTATMTATGEVQFEAVQSPEIEGFRAKPAKVSLVVPNENGEFETTVTYMLKQVPSFVTLYDSTTNETLSTISSQGEEAIIQEAIQALTDKGYQTVLVDWLDAPVADGVMQIDLQHKLQSRIDSREVTHRITFTGLETPIPEVVQKATVMHVYQMDLVTNQPADERFADRFASPYLKPGYMVLGMAHREDGQVRFDSVSVPEVAEYQPDTEEVTLAVPLDQLEESIVTNINYTKN